MRSTETFPELFEIILSGEKEASRQAAREVRKLLYSDRGKQGGFQGIKAIINEAPGTYETISEDWRQEKFVMAVSVLYFLNDRDNQPDFIFPWLFSLLLHRNGYIRHAAVRMVTDELGPLTVHLRHPKDKYHKQKIEQSEAIIDSMFMALSSMLISTRDPKYRRYKFIDSLPASPFKSVQMLLRELEDMCGESHMRSLESRYLLK